MIGKLVGKVVGEVLALPATIVKEFEDAVEEVVDTVDKRYDEVENDDRR